MDKGMEKRKIEGERDGREMKMVISDSPKGRDTACTTFEG